MPGGSQGLYHSEGDGSGRYSAEQSERGESIANLTYGLDLNSTSNVIATRISDKARTRRIYGVAAASPFSSAGSYFERFIRADYNGEGYK